MAPKKKTKDAKCKQCRRWGKVIGPKVQLICAGFTRNYCWKCFERLDRCPIHNGICPPGSSSCWMPLDCQDGETTIIKWDPDKESPSVEPTPAVEKQSSSPINRRQKVSRRRQQRPPTMLGTWEPLPDMQTPATETESAFLYMQATDKLLPDRKPLLKPWRQEDPGDMQRPRQGTGYMQTPYQ